MTGKRANRSFKELIFTFAPAIVLIVAGFWVAAQFVSPAPPKHIIIATGMKNGAYYQFAEKYRDELAREGITVEIKTSSGSKNNIALLLEKKADIAFVQGGAGNPDDALLSLGSLYYEPVWIFLNKQVLAKNLADLISLHVAIGPPGSGTRLAGEQLLARNHINRENTDLQPLSGLQAADSLSRHKIDAALFVSSAKAEAIQTLLHDPEVRLLSLYRADAYNRLLPYLSRVTLPEGIIDLHDNIPPRPIEMLAPAANLVVREDFHSALIVLFLRAAKKIHHGANLFSPPDTFPSSQLTAFPLSEVADRFYKVGPPFLMRYLPFWAAIFIDRMMVFLIPMLALMFPLFKVMPPLYRWRVRSRIYRWYRELQEIDDESFSGRLTPEQQKKFNRRLAQIEEEVIKVNTPLSYADQLYNLLLHIDLVKKKVNGQSNNVKI